MGCVGRHSIGSSSLRGITVVLDCEEEAMSLSLYPFASNPARTYELVYNDAPRNSIWIMAARAKVTIHSVQNSPKNHRTVWVQLDKAANPIGSRAAIQMRRCTRGTAGRAGAAPVGRHSLRAGKANCLTLDRVLRRGSSTPPGGLQILLERLPHRIVQCLVH
jgi:hypothetical protein